MKTRILLTISACLSLLTALPAQNAWQNHPVLTQFEGLRDGVIPFIPGLNLASITLLSLAALLWLFYFREVWQDSHREYARRLLHGVKHTQGNIRALRLSTPAGDARGYDTDWSRGKLIEPRLRAAKGDKPDQRQQPDRSQDTVRG